MDNQNKKEYLETIKSLTLDNLRYLPHAPSVQMQTVPPDTLSFEDYGEADDLDMCFERMPNLPFCKFSVK